MACGMAQELRFMMANRLKNIMKLSIPEQHQKRIAIHTLKMSDAGALIMGGMSKDEARAFLARIGYTKEQIAKLES